MYWQEYLAEQQILSGYWRLFLEGRLQKNKFLTVALDLKLCCFSEERKNNPWLWGSSKILVSWILHVVEILRTAVYSENPYSKKPQKTQPNPEYKKSYPVTCSLLLWKSMKHPKLVLLLCLKIKSGGWPSPSSLVLFGPYAASLQSLVSVGTEPMETPHPIWDLTSFSPLELESYYLYNNDLNRCISIC